MSTFLVFFPTASYDVDERYQPDLDRMAEQVMATSDTVQLLGYTDNIGTAAANRLLSEKRARAVRQYLARAGVPQDRIRIAYFGEEQPKADNETEAGRSQNRRVEIRLSSAPAILDELTVKGDTTLYEADKLDELQKLIGLPPNARLVNKPLPVPPQPTEVKLNAIEKHITSSNGSTLKLRYQYKSGNVRPLRILLQIAGATSFYEIPMSVTATAGKLAVPMSFPTQLAEGEIAVVACLINARGRVSRPDTIFVGMERVGTGKLQVTLAWDTDSDQDLYVELPSGEVISYQDPYSNTGGELDRDDTDGFGPENIFWLEDAPDGKYVVSVNDYSHTVEDNAFVITINGMGENRQFYGATREGSTAIVATFIKEGNKIVWE